MTINNPWKIHQVRQVERVLSKLPDDLVGRIDAAIWDLARNPWPQGCRKLTGIKQDNLYRIRVGDWRISYAIEKDERLVVILEVAPRGGAYRLR
jgi:mRNA interferase RelE/StbE